MTKIIVIAAPSGAGKSTIISGLLTKHSELEFAVSATTRKPRVGETNGKEYYFVSKEDFKNYINTDQILEWQEVYSGSYYGTLKSEITRISDKGKVILFDLDVVGALNIKKMCPYALLIFILPPSMEELKKRLENRSTDSSDEIAKRLAKASTEISLAPEFDYILLNDNLEEAESELDHVIQSYIGNNLIPGSFKCF